VFEIFVSGAAGRESRQFYHVGRIREIRTLSVHFQPIEFGTLNPQGRDLITLKVHEIRVSGMQRQTATVAAGRPYLVAGFARIQSTESGGCLTSCESGYEAVVRILANPATSLRLYHRAT
jgi:hypothetical protein